MAWSIGALVGALLGFTFDADAWFAGAVTGGIIGWLVARQTDGAAGSGPAARPRLSRPRQRRPLRPQT